MALQTISSHQLVKSGVAGDRDASRRVAEALVADERSKQRSAAERLEGVLKGCLALGARCATRGHCRASDQAAASDARHHLSQRHQSCADRGIIEEQDRSDAVALTASSPDTQCCWSARQASARQVWLKRSPPLSLAASIRSNTTRSLAAISAKPRHAFARVFDHARTNPCVLFFDEFDAIGKSAATPPT